MELTITIMDKDAKIMSRWKYTAISAFGFGIGGALWGLEAYRGTVGSDEVFTNPFSYILGAVALGVFGGFALTAKYHKGVLGINLLGELRNCFTKTTLKVILLGTTGWLVAFIVPAVGVYQLWLFGGILTIVPELFIDVETIDNFLLLKPSLEVGSLWLEFLLTGAIIGLAYSLILKTRILKTTLWGMGGFVIGSLIGPISGNLVGNLFNSLLINYILTFLFIGAVLGACLSLSAYRKTTQSIGSP